MPDFYSKIEIAHKLHAIQTGLSDSVQAMNAAQFEQSPEGEWSAADYLKHLILSVKPFARGISLPPEKLHELFGAPERPSMTYGEFTGLYMRRLAEGVRAEDYDSVTPISYRMPGDAADVKSALLTAWNDGNNRLLAALETLSDENLDLYQMPHPAIGPVTLREMLYFTVHHNQLHWDDIQRVGGASG